MKLSNKISLAVLSASMFLGLATPLTAFAVAAPDLGTASTFSVFAGSAMTADGSGATVSGDLGVNPGLTASGPWTVGGGQYFGTGGRSGTGKTDATAAWTAIGSTGGTAWNPDGSVPADMTPAAGLYTRSGDSTISTTLTLNGTASSVWIFQISSSLTFTNAATVVLGAGVNPCNVYWRIASTATINGNVGKQFVGTLIAYNDVSLVTGATVIGRMMALTGTLSTAGITNVSGCATPSPVGKTSQSGSITVVKNVINDNGGTKTVADFPLFVNGVQVVSGVTNNFPAPGPAYTITETSNSNYTQTFSGACDSNGHLNLNPGDLKICVITNDDKGAVAAVPPLIDVVKVPSPLALPNGPGPVTYTYTLRNIGTVPVTDITMVGDTCSPIVLSSGDTNNDKKLDVSETWVHHCTTTLSATHTNIVTATGWANGISAVDVANATVVVGTSAVPPLIHVTKIPSPLSLSAGGGTVIYLEKVTNPGTVALSNVTLIDDKCSPMKYISGDTNNDKKLDTTETWLYTCQSNLTRSTTNTATAIGGANGLTATDFAVATVLVAAPGLPNTGLPTDVGGVSLDSILLALILIVVVTSLVMTLRRREM